MKLGVNKLTILLIEKRIFKSLAYCNELKTKQAIKGKLMKEEKKNMYYNTK